uniref:Peptidyl-prolyl cis-trans isomerase n=1 Tax=Caenorhabditis tropicalis TaxID=1561998 RepID=A0A1I7UYZ6_9PELO
MMRVGEFVLPTATVTDCKSDGSTESKKFIVQEGRIVKGFQKARAIVDGVEKQVNVLLFQTGVSLSSIGRDQFCGVLDEYSVERTGCPTVIRFADKNSISWHIGSSSF